MENDKEMTEPKQIMTKIYNFYSKHDKDSYKLGENTITRFLDTCKMNTKKLSSESERGFRQKVH